MLRSTWTFIALTTAFATEILVPTAQIQALVEKQTFEIGIALTAQDYKLSQALVYEDLANCDHDFYSLELDTEADYRIFALYDEDCCLIHRYLCDSNEQDIEPDEGGG